MLENMNPDISAQLAAVGVCRRDGEHRRRPPKRSRWRRRRGSLELVYDRLVWATGIGSVPAVPGFAEYGSTSIRWKARSVGLYQSAGGPSTPARNTAVVVARG
ncbi:hypothetical protein M8494_02770 [Serratia ureilytica]